MLFEMRVSFYNKIIIIIILIICLCVLIDSLRQGPGNGQAHFENNQVE